MNWTKILIPVPWGNIAGKWWGPRNVRPIVCVHGWLDNAGTFDRLIPLLPQHLGYLAIDMPGHGLSSWLPTGASYNFFDLIFVFKIIKQNYKWEKISIMGHSMGSAMSFLYSGIYPEDVDLLIALDVLKSPAIKPNQIIKILQFNVENHLKSTKDIIDGKEIPSFTQEEIVNKLITNSGNTLTKEAAFCFLERGSIKSKTNQDRYVFTHDNRIKSGVTRMVDTKVIEEMGKRIIFPVIYFQSTIINPEAPFYEEKKTNDLLRDTNPNYESYMAEGSHHFHLTNADGIKHKISNFINKHRPASVENSKL